MYRVCVSKLLVYVCMYLNVMGNDHYSVLLPPWLTWNERQISSGGKESLLNCIKILMQQGVSPPGARPLPTHSWVSTPARGPLLEAEALLPAAPAHVSSVLGAALPARSPTLLFSQWILRHRFCVVGYMPSDFLNLGLEQ